jgi:hypothetical protein
LPSCQRVIVDKDVSINVCSVYSILISPDSHQKEPIFLHILGFLLRASCDDLHLLQFRIPNFDELVGRDSSDVLIVDPINSKDAAVVSIFPLHYFLETFAFIYHQATVGSSAHYIGALRTVPDMVDEATVTSIGLYEIVGRAIEALDFKLIASHN